MDEEYFDDSTLFSAFDSVEDGDRNVITSKSKAKRKNNISSAEVDSLKKENELLKKVLRKIVSTPCPDEESPVASIVYFKSSSLRERQSEIEELITQFAKEVDREADNKTDLSNGPSFKARSHFCDAFALAQGKYSGIIEEEDGECLDYDFCGIPVGSVQYFGSFCLDSFGSSVVNLTARRPAYEQVYFNILPDDGNSRTRSRRPKPTCFNCDGDHKLQDCEQPRDLARISMKRQQFKESFSSIFSQERRYHAEKDNEKKFGHLAAGKTSENLREALGLSRHDLPPYIYRMRMLGYPPGWLPSNHDSGIVMYGKEGKAEESTGEEKSVNPDHFVHFPGFNCAIPEGTKDLSYEVQLPTMNSRDQLPINRSVVPLSERSREERRSSEDDYNRLGCKRKRTSQSEMEMEIENDTDTGEIYVNDSTVFSESANDRSLTNGTWSPTLPLETLHRTSTPLTTKWSELEDGEIPESPTSERKDGNFSGTSQKIEKSEKSEDIAPSWWLKEPLQSSGVKDDEELVPPPFPLRALPLHKISQILPGEMNHISFEDRGLWLDPIFGNLQVRTGRYDKLKTILGNRERKKK